MTYVIEQLLTFIGKLGELQCDNEEAAKEFLDNDFTSVLTHSDIRSVLSDDVLSNLPLSIQRKLIFRSICPFPYI